MEKGIVELYVQGGKGNTDGTSWQQLIRPLDEGSFDQIGLLRQLRELDYKGPLGQQCYGIKINPGENLRRSVKAWKKNLAEFQ